LLCIKSVLKENFYEHVQSDDVGLLYKQNWTIVSSASASLPSTTYWFTSMVITDGILGGSFYRINCIITWNDIHIENFTQMPQELNIVKYCHQLQTQFFGRIILCRSML
jgi:hypothetical protein